MNKLLNFSLLLLALWIVSCEDDNLLTPKSNLIVVQAYLFAGEPANDIRITDTLPLDADTTFAPPINDAQVILIKNNARYELLASPGDSGYYHYPGHDLSVEAGDVFYLEINYNGETIHAETTVPEKPEGIKLSKHRLDILDMENNGFGNFGALDSMGIELTWQNEDDELFYVVIDNIEENPTEIETIFGQIPRRFISQPMNRNSYMIKQQMITHYGQHRIKLYRVNQEYADLYMSRQQDSRDLNEPLTNIENGLGVFSAFNSDSLLFEAVEE